MADSSLDLVCFRAMQALPGSSKAALLLNSARTLIDAGHYGEEVESYFDALLRMPGLAREQMTTALLARGAARRAAGEQLVARAEQDFRQVLQLDPLNEQARAMLGRDRKVSVLQIPLHRRLPLEVWELIASYIPRFHLKPWLNASAFFRDIAQRTLFRTVDVYLSEDSEVIARAMDFFERVKADPTFASRVRSLRLHLAMEDSELLDVLLRIIRTTLPSLSSLSELEWVGYPEFGPETVDVLRVSHPRIQSIGMVGWHFDAIGVSSFCNLRKFSLRAEDDDGSADMREVREVLDNNEATLRHLCLGASLNRPHSWDDAFEASVIRDLLQLHLVDTRISHLVLTRLMHASQLRSLTLHGALEDANAAVVLLGTDHIVDGEHTLFPLLEDIRFVMVEHDDDINLHRAVTRFIRNRPRLRRLDLGSCQLDLLLSILPTLTQLRVFRLRAAFLSEQAVCALTKTLPADMTAIHLAATSSARPLHEHAREFTRFRSLAVLHLNRIGHRRPQPNSMSEKDLQAQTDAWFVNARSIAQTVRSLDFVGWHREHFAVVRSRGGDVTELKELPVRKRLDCGQGVDLGGLDGAWLERKDVPVDWETPGLEVDR